MANEKKLIHWWLENQKKYQGKIKRYLWSQRFGFEFFDYRVMMTVDGVEVRGRGGDFNEELALVKGIAECLERIVCRREGMRSNGVAAHFDLSCAQQNARLEYLERDLFFCHYLTHQGFYHLKENDLNAHYQKIIAYYRQKKIKIEFYALGESRWNKIVACCAEGENYNYPFGLILGMGSSYSAQEAQEKSFLECIRNVMAIEEGNLDIDYTPGDFENEKVSVMKHIDYALDLKNFKNHQFLVTGARPLKESKKEKTNFSFTTYDLSEFAFPFSFWVVRAQEKSLQQAFWGKTKKEYINLERMRVFTGNQELDYQDLNYSIHPLG